MLRGAFNCSGGAARDLEVVHRLGQSELFVQGPLAITAGQTSRSGFAEVDGISCALDGYLYDAPDLARELDLDVESPPELVGRAYQRLGEDLLTKLRGRFALVLWDSRRERGLLASDLLATQPLFISRGAGWVGFASELEDLLAILPSRPGPDATGFISWLGGGTCPEGSTLYEGVSRLRPGQLLDLGVGASQARRYWRPSYSGTARGTRDELAEGLREELERSVRRRLSPRSSGVILSGGLDSSIVTAVASQVRRPDALLRTYSGVFPGFPEFDESWKVRSLTKKLGIEPGAFEVEPQGAVWLGLRHVQRWGLPMAGVGSLIDVSMVNQAAADGTEVVLDGQTGDEVLGFSPYLVADRLRHGRMLGALGLARRWPLGRPSTPKERLYILREMGLKGTLPHRLQQVARGLRNRNGGGPRWLLPTFRSQYQEQNDRWAWKAAARGPRWWRYLMDSLVVAPHRELRLDYLRHRAAAVGLVNESPLYDFDLIDYCLRVPPDIAFESAHTRPLAREAMRGLVPDDVRLSDKKAIFSSFCFALLTGADSPGIDRLLTAPDAEIGAYADMEWVRDLWKRDRPRPGADTMQWGTAVWRLAAAECWLRAQADDGFVAEMLAHPDVPEPSVRPVALGGTRTFPAPPFSPLVKA